MIINDKIVVGGISMVSNVRLNMDQDSDTVDVSVIIPLMSNYYSWLYIVLAIISVIYNVW